MAWILILPARRENPPPGAVIDQLEAVDPAGEGLFALSVTRFVGAPDMDHMVPLFNAVGDRRLEETLIGEYFFAACDEVLGSQDPGGDRAFVVAAGRNQSCAWVVECAETVPITRRAGRARDHIVDRSQDVFDGVDVS